MNAEQRAQRLSGRQKLLLLLVAILFVIGAVLCPLEFGTMFWGNWLHTMTFHLGLVAILLAIALLIGTFTKSGIGLLAGVLLGVPYAFLFGTFPGWLLLYHFIEWAFIPGPTPRGM